jgi:hypothetical protein
MILKDAYGRGTCSLPHSGGGGVRSKRLCAYSASGFRDNLIAKHPNLSARITEIIQPYE